MKGIRSLVGYLTTKENEELVFAILINGLVGPRDVERKLENEICKYLATYRQE